MDASPSLSGPGTGRAATHAMAEAQMMIELTQRIVDEDEKMSKVRAKKFEKVQETSSWC